MCDVHFIGNTLQRSPAVSTATPLRRRRWPQCLSLLIVVFGTAVPVAADEPMTLKDYMVLDGPAPSEHVAYGPQPQQYAEYFAPTGAGPYPTVVILHGGCFMNEYAGVKQMRGMAADLAAHGVAAWNVEYRGLDTPGGGYPGTFLDVRAALDMVVAQAPARQLDTRRVEIVGHSAGAFLGLWAVGRQGLPVSSPLYEPHALAVTRMVALGAPGDIQAMSQSSKATCDFEIAQLTGTPSATRPDVLVDTSPFNLVPPTTEITFINGDHDTITTPRESGEYAKRLGTHGICTHTLLLPGASHFDEVSVTSSSWGQVEAAILEGVGAR